MLEFKDFLEASEEESDIRRTLAKLPSKYRRFLKGFAISFQGGNTLRGDNQHVGVITTHPRKQIIVAAPWFYSREFTLLHEIGHLVWEHLIDPSMKETWEGVVKRTKHKQNQNPEELFCMAFADFYTKHKVVTHHHPEWGEFIDAVSDV